MQKAPCIGRIGAYNYRMSVIYRPVKETRARQGRRHLSKFDGSCDAFSLYKSLTIMHSADCWGQNLACMESEATKHNHGLEQPESALQAALQ